MRRELICADLVDTTGRVINPLDGGPSEGRYWATGDRIYFSDPVTDAMPDSIAVRVRGDTLEFVGKAYVLDRTAVRALNVIASEVCGPIRASSEGVGAVIFPA